MNAASSRKLDLLRWEAANLQRYLDGFEPAANCEARIVGIGNGAEYLFARNFPMPDSYQPDYIDLLVIVDDFPAKPPIGIYVLNRQNAALIGQLAGRFNAFPDKAYYSAPAIRNYTWICYHYDDNAWRYRADNPARGDNIAKFLAGFYAESMK